MSNLKLYTYILIAAAATYLMRVLALTLIRKPIRNRFIRSFLHYVPYVTLSVMTFPAILTATGSTLIGGIAFVITAVASFFGANSFVAAIICSMSALVLQLVL